MRRRILASWASAIQEVHSSTSFRGLFHPFLERPSAAGFMYWTLTGG